MDPKNGPKPDRSIVANEGWHSLIRLFSAEMKRSIGVHGAYEVQASF